MTNNDDSQNTTQKMNVRGTWTPIKTGGELVWYEELAITAPLATPVVLILNASFPQKWITVIQIKVQNK